MKNEFYILRHGETEYQGVKKGLIYPSHGETPLSEKGRKDAFSAAKKVKKEKIDVIYASPFRRTKETAEAVKKETGVSIIFDSRLRDLHLGVYHGRNKTEFYDRYPHSEKRFKEAPPEGESWGDLLSRVKDFLEDIDSKHSKKKILIVSHADPLWLLEGYVRGTSLKDLLRIRITKQGFINTGELRKVNEK